MMRTPWEGLPMTALLGFDVGSSSVKAALLDTRTGKLLASAASPETEMVISAPRPGWAEQDPALWWEHVVRTAQSLRAQAGGRMDDVQAIGIAYQMHGLVVVDRQHKVLRPSIIWCDSRAVAIGEQAAERLGHDLCLERFLNLPGNFTASKLRWVQENEPEVYRRIHKAMLPGDYVALRMTGEIRTTPSGLSEGILWDYMDQGLAQAVLDAYDLSPDLIAEVVPTFTDQGALTPQAADALGLKPGIPVSYRAGDQANNALSLSVLNAGEVAATAGTSGVIYGVTDKPLYDPGSRVNPFVHVNHEPGRPRYGVLLCINGTGILNSWIKRLLSFGTDVTYEYMNETAAEAPPGAGGIRILPYGNGAERSLGNREIGASIHGLNFNIHNASHVLRAVQEGIVFALNHGLQIMRDMGMEVHTVRAGAANLFLSPLFRTIFSTVTGTTVELFNTDGAQGAARGAGIGAKVLLGETGAYAGLDLVCRSEPDRTMTSMYRNAFEAWSRTLSQRLQG
jgi:xylulokinase